MLDRRIIRPRPSTTKRKRLLLWKKVDWPPPTAAVSCNPSATEDHALAVERHLFADRLHTRVCPHLLVRGVANRSGRVLDPAEHHDLVILGFHSAPKIGELAVRDIVPPALNHPGRSELLEEG